MSEQITTRKKACQNFSKNRKMKELTSEQIHKEAINAAVRCGNCNYANENHNIEYNCNYDEYYNTCRQYPAK